jgi:hypothetical protein
MQVAPCRRILGTVETEPDPGSSPASLPRCRLCGEVVGMYEPYVLVGEAGAHVSSRVAEPLGPSWQGTLHHLACYQDA